MNHTLRGTVRKVGGSLMLLLPKDIAKGYNLNEGDTVDLTLSEDSIIISTIDGPILSIKPV